MRGQTKFALGLWTLVFLLFTGLGAWLGGYPGIFKSVGLCGLLLAFTLRFFILVAPEAMVVVTVNLLAALSGKTSFKDQFYVYPSPGIVFKYPWEKVDKKNFFSTKVKPAEVVEETFPSKDGPVMHVRYSYQYRVDPNNAVAHLMTDPETIKAGIKEMASGVLSQKIAKMNAKAARTKIDDIDETVREALYNKEVEGGKKLADKYGIILVLFVVADVDYEKDYQTALSTQAALKKLRETAKRIQKGWRPADGKMEIADKDAMNLALIVNKNITKNVQEVEGEGGQALSALLMAMARGGRQ